MAIFARARDCTCPGTPHDEGDGVYLRPSLDMDGGLAAEHELYQASIRHPLPPNPTPEQAEEVARAMTLEVRPAWFRLFLTHGAEGWNLVNEQGPVPFSIDALRSDYAFARPVAEKADELYRDAILAPFLGPPPTHSRNGQTDGGTPRRPVKTPRRLRSSSPVTSVGSESWTA